MEEREEPYGREESAKGTISDSEAAGLHRTDEEGPAQPSDEAEDRNKSPRGGARYDDDEIAVDPEDAPTANAFLIRITAVMFVLVALLVLAGITHSTLFLIIALVAIPVGAYFVLKAVFQMMAGD
jgi:hypothetical protein